MDTQALVGRESDYAERRSNTALDALWPGQRHMIRAAQIAFGAQVLDCALLETMRGGARVHLLASVEVPEIVTLRVDGACWTLQRRWQRADEIGFKVVGDAIPPE